MQSAPAGVYERAPDVTVVIPTRNERDNIRALLDRIAALELLGLVVLFVDDSVDDTPQVVLDAAPDYPMPIGLIHRPQAERLGGLGAAAHAGLCAAESEYVCVMDGDLQHPPEVIGALIEQAERTGADVVVASRFCAASQVGGLSRSRRAVSRVLIAVAKVLFPHRLSDLSDPLSGFFLIRRSRVSLDRMRPNGFKVLLEILLSGPPLTCQEVPFHFDVRYAGDSKAGAREAARYVALIVRHRLRSPRLSSSDAHPLSAQPDAN